MTVPDLKALIEEGEAILTEHAGNAHLYRPGAGLWLVKVKLAELREELRQKTAMKVEERVSVMSTSDAIYMPCYKCGGRSFLIANVCEQCNPRLHTAYKTAMVGDATEYLRELEEAKSEVVRARIREALG